MRRRLDAEMVRRGMARSRHEAVEAVATGLVRVGGRVAAKPATLVDANDPIVLVGTARRYASRGGHKLEAALDRFLVDPSGRDCLDAGASTGGFTDCLLRRGAARVLAVDVGYGQLAWELRTDDRVVVVERTNVRDLRPEGLAFRPALLTADLSFISLRVALPALAGVAAPGGEFVLLVKPQFEVGREAVGRAGVVRDPVAWGRSLRGVLDACDALGLSVRAAMPSPLLGPAGNVEFFLHAEEGGPARAIDLDATLEEAVLMRDRVSSGAVP